MQFVTVEIYSGDTLVHTHENIPAPKVVDLILNWSYDQGVADFNFKVITDSVTKEMSL